MSKFLIMVSGQDRPGITSRLMGTFVRSGCSILDIGQSVTHGFLSLNILLKAPAEDNSVIRELRAEIVMDRLSLEYKEVDDDFCIEGQLNGDKYILSCVAYQPIVASYIRELSDILVHYGANILRIDNIKPSSFSSLKIDTILPKSIDVGSVKRDLLRASNTYSIDAAFIRDRLYRQNKRLVAFDMDSTLIQNEVIDDLAERKGKKQEMEEITEKTMRGEIDFDQSLRHRTTMLEGLTEEDMEVVAEQLVLTPGCSELIQVLRQQGYKTAVISGGFSFFTQKLKSRLGLDYHFANNLEMVNGKATGCLQGTLVNPEEKAQLLINIAREEKIPLRQTVAIGDGANDIPMLNAAGLGIAYHAKEIVQNSAPHILNHGPLTSILYFLGIPPSALEDVSL